MDIVFATTNENKLREIREILDSPSYNVLSAAQAGVNADIEETGNTFKENALCKARGVYELLKSSGKNLPDAVLADDSGLVIDALNGEPGIYSARYLGHDTPYEVKNAELLKRMQDVPDEKRSARFICAVAAVFKDGSNETAEGIFEGRIAHEIKGENGFGYDPIFFLPELNVTSAELTEGEKNKISHRGKALREMCEILKKHDTSGHA